MPYNNKNMNYPDHTEAYRLYLKIDYGYIVICTTPEEKYVKNIYKNLGFNFRLCNAKQTPGNHMLCFLCADDATAFAQKHFPKYAYDFVQSQGPEELVRIDLDNDIPCYVRAEAINDRSNSVVQRRKSEPIRASKIDPGTETLRKRIAKDKKNAEEVDSFVNIIGKYWDESKTTVNRGTIAGKLKDDLLKLPEDFIIKNFEGFFSPEGKISIYLSLRDYNTAKLFDYNYEDARKAMEQFNEGGAGHSYYRNPALSFNVYVPYYGNKRREETELEEKPLEITATRNSLSAKTPEKLAAIIEEFCSRMNSKLAAVDQLIKQLGDYDEL